MRRRMSGGASLFLIFFYLHIMQLTPPRLSAEHKNCSFFLVHSRSIRNLHTTTIQSVVYSTCRSVTPCVAVVAELALVIEIFLPGPRV